LPDLAERSGVTRARIGKIGRAKMSPMAVTLPRLAGTFYLTLARLLRSG
jgi:transcriptional regulator with XRE-family HTH domain